MAALPKVSAETWSEDPRAGFDRGRVPLSPQLIQVPVPAKVRRTPSLGESSPTRTLATPRRVTLRAAPAALVVFIGAAFVVVTLTGDQGDAFIGLVLGSSFLLVLLVAYIAFGGTPARSEQTFLEEFDWTGAKGPASDAPALDDLERAQRVFLPSSLSPDTARSGVRAFVEGLVALPPAPPPSASVASRRAYVAALRQEGRRLIGLARVTGVNIEPYRLYLLDARRAAFDGDREGSLRSLRLANELLRRSVESAFLKHQRQARGGGPRGGS